MRTGGSEKWLITGGAGFIGTNFVYCAAAHGNAEIVVLDKLTYAGNQDNLAPLIETGRIEFVHGDICDGPLLDELFASRRFDKIFNFAAETHVDRSIQGAAPFIETNIYGTHTLLEAARRLWKDAETGKLYLHVSTDEVYGDLPPAAPPADEATPYRPSSPYAASKAAADHLVRAWARTYGLPCIVTNCSNNYGPWQFPEKFIPLLVMNAIEQREIPIYGDGLQVRDWLHVADHCNALLRIAEVGRPGDEFNIGGDNQRTNISIAKAVCDAVDEALGRTSGSSHALLTHIRDRPGHDRRYALDASKLRDTLGWHPQHGFEASLPKLVEWYLQNKAWVDQVRTADYQRYYQQQYRTS